MDKTPGINGIISTDVIILYGWILCTEQIKMSLILKFGLLPTLQQSSDNSAYSYFPNHIASHNIIDWMPLQLIQLIDICDSLNVK